jgi:hypothetical protein
MSWSAVRETSEQEVDAVRKRCSPATHFGTARSRATIGAHRRRPRRPGDRPIGAYCSAVAMPACLPGQPVMKPNPTESKPSELDQAAADRRSFGNTGLAANAEFRVIAEAMRELVAELRLIRRQVDKLVATASRDESVAASHSGKTPGARPAGVE